MVIKCWDDVVLSMKVGQKVTVTCPSKTAYGSREVGGLIPANSDLIFEMELLSVSPKKSDL